SATSRTTTDRPALRSDRMGDILSLTKNARPPPPGESPGYALHYAILSAILLPQYVVDLRHRPGLQLRQRLSRAPHDNPHGLQPAGIKPHRDPDDALVVTDPEQVRTHRHVITQVPGRPIRRAARVRLDCVAPRRRPRAIQPGVDS